MQLSRAALDHAVTTQGGNGRPEKAAAVKGKAHALHIFAVQTGLVRDLQFVPATDLRPAGKAGLYIICLRAFCFLIVVYIVDYLRLIGKRK